MSLSDFLLSPCIVTQMLPRVNRRIAPRKHVFTPARRDQRDQHVLIEGHRIFVVVEFFIVRAEPMRKRRVDASDRFPKTAPGQRRAAATGIVRDDNREALILRARPERSFAKPRMAE